MKYGFSLVELSIVLVILGLLTGGILTGQNLIRAAEIRSITTSYESYLTATMTFRDKYFAIPGDMRNATDFWTGSTACSGANADGVCNGDGDGRLDNPTADGAVAESFQFWRHLAKAGLIEGTYTGLSSAGPAAQAGYGYIKGENTPNTKISDVVWEVLWRDAAGVSSQSYDIDVGHHLHLGRYIANDVVAKEGRLLPEEAWSIDTKVDDGRPAYGRVIANVFDANCTRVNSGTHTATNFDSEYNLSNTNKVCGLYFINLF